ncbi:hypothetical protein HDU91_003232 [Kappamyces sp. JEL0680]|nr:hypothetical protein HDU91_003232 [Kappamyces sp. JEL0680]
MSTQDPLEHGPPRKKGRKAKQEAVEKSDKATDSPVSNSQSTESLPPPSTVRIAVIAQGQKPWLVSCPFASIVHEDDEEELVFREQEWERKVLLISGDDDDRDDTPLASSTIACSACFSPDAQYGAVGSLVTFSPLTGARISSFKVTPSSIVKQIVFSPAGTSGRDMLVNSSDRVLRCYSLESAADGSPEFELVSKYLDAVERTQWSDCCITADGEYVVASSSLGEAHKMSIWDKESGRIFKTLTGPSEGLLGIRWHPTRPIMATISEFYGCVYLWRHTPQQKFSAYEPTFTELEDNLEYVEREDEFDIVEGGVKVKAEADESADVDILES